MSKIQEGEIEILIDASDRMVSGVVNDGVELGMGNKIPLWLFGFLY